MYPAKRLVTGTSPAIERKVLLKARNDDRSGQDVSGPLIGVPARTVGRILRRHNVPYLR